MKSKIVHNTRFSSLSADSVKLNFITAMRSQTPSNLQWCCSGWPFMYATIGLLLVLAAAETCLYTFAAYKLSTIRATSITQQSCGCSSSVALSSHSLPSAVAGNSSTAAAPPQKKKLAYAFYAASDVYHCSCLVNVKRLLDLGKARDIDVVILLPGIYGPKTELSTQGKKLGIRYKLVTSLEVGTFTTRATSHLTSYYNGVMSKLHAFNLTEYDRVMFLDADQLVLKSPEILFDYVPEAMLAAPRAYWLLPGQFPKGYQTDGWPSGNGPEVGPQMKFGSYMMLIQPSEYLWGRVYGKYYKDGKPGFQDLFDMDLLNIEFKDDVTLLPGRLAVISNDYMDAHADPRPVNLHHVPLEDWWHGAYTLHFSQPGKVWSWPPQAFNATYPQTHALLKGAWQTWWSLHALVC